MIGAVHRARILVSLSCVLVFGCALGSTSHTPDAGDRDDAQVPLDDAGPPDAGAITCSELTCDPDATCDASSGRATCVCNDGFEGTGVTCTDIDECALVPNPCEPGTCTNERGGYSCDLCPDDPEKTEPGVCGCGVPDADSDGDGTLDCLDGCPSDPLKTAPGACGCGIADTDSDSDGTADCVDGCPSDPLKTAPGACGCGVADTDSDSDGTPNCTDGCPSDPLKSAPGVCGCGVADTDSDSDGTPDCTDGCPSDPLKTAPGACGCGVPDTSGTTSSIGEPRTSSYTASPFFRGNAYQVTTSVQLQSFEQYLELPASCTLGFYVLRGSGATGPWTTVWSSAAARSGAGYQSSGTIGITLSPGYHYALGVGWTCSGVTYEGNSGGWSGYATNIGAYRGNIWDNAYAGYSTSYSPPNAGGATLAYAQRITTGGCP